ncbi:MAG: hypothetical protein H6828_03420 [Planctomycetes bacterium]|nr:hypothetical protein [Planctomycetota bacterium]
MLALVAFLAGLAAGLTGAELSRSHEAPTGASADLQRYAEAFDLDAERQRLLAGLLDHYNRDLEEIQNRYTAEIRREMEPELRRKGLEYRSLLRDRLLPPEQRARFDSLSADFQDTL